MTKAEYQEIKRQSEIRKSETTTEKTIADNLKKELSKFRKEKAKDKKE